MGFHLAAYTQLTALASALMQPVPAQADSLLSIVGSGFQLRQWNKLLAAYVTGPTLTRAQIVAPSMRMITPGVEIYPLETAVTPANPPKLCSFLDRPFTLAQSEEVDLNVINNNANDNVYGLIWLCDQLKPVPPGRVYILHGSSTTTSVAGTWTQVTVVWDQLPQAGVYAIVGSSVYSATGIAHRFFHQSQVERPGSLSAASIVSLPHDLFMLRQMGEYLRFDDWQMPRVEVLCDAAESVHNIEMQIVQVGPSNFNPAIVQPAYP